ncbi:MAG: hypothetical protein JO108_13450 [Acidobacteriaceae bacterium]|nr:hypothetical protein [Acidobacteriaceae bacterium]
MDYVITLSESHLKRTLREWVKHYTTGRPHQSLGPGIPPTSRISNAYLRQTGKLKIDPRRSASRISMG